MRNSTHYFVFMQCSFNDQGPTSIIIINSRIGKTTNSKILHSVNGLKSDTSMIKLITCTISEHFWNAQKQTKKTKALIEQINF